MKPPICIICGKRFQEYKEGDIVFFRKRDTDIEWEQEKKVEHPPNAEWFCNKHLSYAKKLEQLHIHEAMKILRKKE